MKKLFLSVPVLALILSLSSSAWAQYPSVPADVGAATDAMMDEVRRLSDEAWEQALPIVKQEEAQGLPYVPWAARPDDLLKADIPAFPGAEGGGIYSLGGRGGRVLVVTSLADRGPGTLREACEQGGTRVVVFNVAGIIRLKTPLIVRAPYLTIAGQTAPGDGICVAGESVWIDTHDVVIRHLRFRRGETDVGRRDDALGGNAVGNIMIDHCSASWGLDENISMYRHMYDPGDGSKARKLPTVNITFQNCISSEALDTYNHSFGSTIGGANCAFIRNLWANNTGRNPSIGMNGQFNFVNNVIYNWRHRSLDGGDRSSLYNVVNNYYKPGPVTLKDEPVGHRILKPEAGGRDLVFGKAYVNGNVVEGYDDITRDNWAGGVQIEDMPDAGQYRDSLKVDEPFPLPPMNVMPAREAYAFVLDNVGATLPKRDAVDRRIIEQIRTGKVTYSDNIDEDSFYQFQYRRLGKDSYKQGIITDIRLVGGYPEYKGTPYKDTDGDGMPDAWELKYGLDPNAPADAALDCNGDGYTNIEKFINGIDPTKKVDWTDPKNNVDTLAAHKDGVWADVLSAPQAADPDPAYTQAIIGRSENIVKNLGIDDEAKHLRVRNLIVQQYRNLNAMHGQRDRDRSEEGTKHISALIKRVHQDYLGKLAVELTPEQVDMVKDGMTYGVMPATYKVYLSQQPNLTDAQKARIMAFLVEAREKAMDGGSSSEKHGIFRQYKGKINNYLSAEGYTLK